jgi:tRNA threonylcarbamoyl adenosine modification protein YeaZ
MKILALEFSSERRSAALWDGAGEVAEVAENGGRRLQAFALIDEALRRAGWEREAVECLAVGLGPGSYTGVRAAIAVAQGWQLARNVHLLGISSADALAAQAQADGCRGRVHVVINAQRGEFYSAGYDLGPGSPEIVAPLRLLAAPEAQALAKTGLVLLGPDLHSQFSTGRILEPSAAAVARLAASRREFVAGDQLQPIYLRATTFVKAPPARLPLS